MIFAAWIIGILFVILLLQVLFGWDAIGEFFIVLLESIINFISEIDLGD